MKINGDKMLCPTMIIGVHFEQLYPFLPALEVEKGESVTIKNCTFTSFGFNREHRIPETSANSEQLVRDYEEGEEG